MSENPAKDGAAAANQPTQSELLESGELERRVQAGELTNEQAAEILQAAARRDAAELGTTMPDNPMDRVTSGGFGSGQGMQKQQTGQNPT